MNHLAGNQENLAERVVKGMAERDGFSQWMGVEILEIKEGYAKIRMKIRPEMVNGLGITHGGLAFSLADSAFAFACNSRNQFSVALEASISFLRPVKINDMLTAEAKEVHNGRTTGLYLVSVTNQDEMQVAQFKGTCVRTGKPVLANE